MVRYRGRLGRSSRGRSLDNPDGCLRAWVRSHERPCERINNSIAPTRLAGRRFRRDTGHGVPKRHLPKLETSPGIVAGVIRQTLAAFSIIVLSACARPAETASIPLTRPASTQVFPAQIVGAQEWIEVDLAAQEVLLHRDGVIVAQLPAATGLTAYPEYRTPAGIFDIQVKEKGPVENAPGVFVSDILIFDFAKDLGIHSRPMDAEGILLDDRLGLPLTAGCVRVGDSGQVYDFAQLGMWVWIH